MKKLNQIFTAVALVTITASVANAQAGLNVNSTINSATRATVNTAKVTEAASKATSAATKATQATLQASQQALKAASNTSATSRVTNASAVSVEAGSMKADGNASIIAVQNVQTKPTSEAAKEAVMGEMKDAKMIAADLRKDNQVNMSSQSASSTTTDGQSTALSNSNQTELGAKSSTPNKVADKVKTSEQRIKNVTTAPKASGAVSGASSASVKKS